jgi:protein-tyrosine phosphatase
MSLRSTLGWILTVLAVIGTAKADAASGETVIGSGAFERAAVSCDLRSNHFTISWFAPGESQVKVFASDSLSGAHPRFVGVGADAGQISIDYQVSVPRLYFLLAAASGPRLIVTDRNLHLDSMPNLRDIGGYRATDRRWVEMGLLYRSEKISQIARADWPIYEGLRLARVIDFRTDQERINEPDRLPAGAEAVPLDVHKDSKLVPEIGLAAREILAGHGNADATEALVEASYREMVSSASGRRAYGAMLHSLIDGPREPVLFHCSSGKDRTGWATALVLSLLGVPRETIVADYMLSNSLLASQNERFMAGNTATVQANLRPLLEVRSRYLGAAFDQVERQYGSITAYAAHGLGFTTADIVELKNRYLSK